MAEATARTRRVEVKHTEDVPDGVTLVLDQDEAEVLADILSLIGGDPGTSRRGYASRIASALMRAGVEWDQERTNDSIDHNDVGTRPNAIRFRPQGLTTGVLF